MTMLVASAMLKQIDLSYKSQVSLIFSDPVLSSHLLTDARCAPNWPSASKKQSNPKPIPVENQGGEITCFHCETGSLLWCQTTSQQCLK